MNNFKPFAGAALAVSLGASAMSANAAPLDWTLKNVTFGDDGTVSGAFSTNSATGAITTYDITIAGGAKLPGAEYDSDDSWIGALHLTTCSDLIALRNCASYFELAFTNPRTSEANDPLVINATQTKYGSYECGNCTPIRVIKTGEAVFSGVTAGVPEPTAWAMILVGFSGLGAAMRSRRRIAAATVQVSVK